MTISANLTLADQMIVVTIDGNTLAFTDVGESQMTTIEGIKLDRKGVEKEFPDLKGNPDWRAEAIKRFKDYFSKIEGEKNKMLYVVGELEKNGYTPNFWQKKGFRTQRFKR